MRILIALIFLISQITWAQTVNKTAEFNYVWGADYFTNWILNPTAKINTANTTTTNATLARDTTNTLDNSASFSLDTSATSGFAEFTLGTVVAPATEDNCEFKGLYRGDGTLYSAQILDGSSNVLASAALLNSSSSWRPFTILYPCAASGSRKVRVTQTTAGTSPAINLGKLYYGQATGVGSGIPNNVFSAKISSTGVVSDENEDFINGNCVVSGTSIFTCTLMSKFTVAPSCTVSSVNAGAVSTNIQATITNTTLVLYGYNTQTNAATATPLIVQCNRSGSDFIQPTITADNWDYDWRSFTPATSQGLGTLGTTECQEKREGSDLLVRCKITAGTTAAAEMRVGFRSGLTSADTTKIPSIQPCGKLYRGAIATTDDTVLCEPSVGYFTFGQQTSAASGLTKANGNGIVSTGGTFAFYARVPIAGWIENQNAPQLVGSVTSDSTSALKTYSCKITNNGTTAAVDSSTSNMCNSITASRTGVGNVTITFGSAFSNLPSCVCSAKSNGTNVLACGEQSGASMVSTTFFKAITGTGATAVDIDFNFNCIGPR